MLKDGELMTSGDAAKALGVSLPMITKLEGAGRLQTAARTVGGFRLFWTRDVERLAKERAKNPPRRKATAR